ncbi:iron uptake system protein EfeO [Galbitalea sp. SE-J8]|uniref:iron uptake system protein EfeO n=1 Tax=Galbitalea sp. SE-J8 TaxID=3054952 RepID=UPI00259C832A|nr:iron uptake system protein EfeO [Galbitalea sp. SE-J8]MDM4764215.1 iron uptake system protein EfeO [Galbitalea sp. SE-J8]
MSRTALIAVPATATIALLLAGCVPNNPASTGSGAAAAPLTVAIDDTSCAVSASTATAGTLTFSLTNSGTDVNEFEILAEDQLRIVGEKENLAPAQTIDYTVQLNPGTYYTACKFQLIGEPIGLTEFTVTGDAVAVDADTKQLADAAAANYVGYLKDQVGQLTPAVQKLVDAYESGDDDTARALFASTRVFYERIEPTAEAFGDLDPKIDYREVDALAEGLDWTGFHRIEKDLWAPKSGDLNSDDTDALAGWAPSTPAERKKLGDQLVADVAQLNQLVTASDFTVGLADISNGAIGLLDEVATSKISGEEDWWSHTDLSDFEANVQGADVAYGYVRDIAAARGDEGAKLVKEIDTQFAALDALLATYGSIDAGFTPYDEVTEAQRKQLSDQVNALAEPLSNLTQAVLGKA